MTRRRIARFAIRIGPPTITAAATYITFWAAIHAHAALTLTITLMGGYLLGWAFHHSRNRIHCVELELTWQPDRLDTTDAKETNQ